LNYGIHNLFNVVTEDQGAPAAILIRALEPLEGVHLMRRRRLRARKAQSPLFESDLCRGPGNLTIALGIDLSDNDQDLTQGPLRIEDRDIAAPALVWSPRVGIRVATDQLWRCSWEGNACVSASRS
jgi:DNA-3-methyladenine glycosylase